MFWMDEPCGLRTTAIGILFFTLGFAGSAAAQQQYPGGPTDPKARKTFVEAQQWARDGNIPLAISNYQKADQQDGGHCGACLNRAYSLAHQEGDLKMQEAILREWLQQVESDKAKAALHLQLGITLQRKGQDEKGAKQDDILKNASNEFNTALQLDPSLAGAHFGLGIALAYLHQDDAARDEFKEFLKIDKENLDMHERAARYVDRIDLARARMAPPFVLTTLDGQQISMDSLKGKVVLIDFWATWCGPCRDALPHIHRIAHSFAGQPLVVLSISLDKDESKWKDFVAKNDMTWLQYRDGYFNGPIARRFAVDAIPATFSIDADGVLEDQHVGDGNIEGKLKKMLARAVEMQNKNSVPAAAKQAPGSGN